VRIFTPQKYERRTNHARPISAEITKLVYWNRFATSSDPLFELWPVTICTEAIQCSSIMAACALYLRPFLEMLQSGFLNLDDMRRNGMMTPFTITSRGQTGNMPTSSSNKSEARRPIRPIRFNEKQSSSGTSDGIFKGKGNTLAETSSQDMTTKRWNMDPSAKNPRELV
jgi:hypothetical protein